MSSSDASVITSNGKLSDLSPGGVEILTRAINTCLPPDELAELFSEEFFSALGSEPNAEFTSCLSSELNGRGGDVVVQAAILSESGSSDIPQPILDMLDNCGDIIITDLFVDQFTKQGIPNSTAQCIADGLKGKISMSELIELGQSSGSSLPPNLQSEIERVAQRCATGG